MLSKGANHDLQVRNCLHVHLVNFTTNDNTDNNVRDEIIPNVFIIIIKLTFDNIMLLSGYEWLYCDSCACRLRPDADVGHGGENFFLLSMTNCHILWDIVVTISCISCSEASRFLFFIICFMSLKE